MISKIEFCVSKLLIFTRLIVSNRVSFDYRVQKYTLFSYAPNFSRKSFGEIWDPSWQNNG